MSVEDPIMRVGLAAELRGLEYLRSLGYWAERGGQGIYSPRVRAQIQGTRSNLRWWVDSQCGIPGVPGSLRMVDVKTRMPYRDGPDVSVEIAPLMLAISGVMSHPTMFMYEHAWAPATLVWEAILPTRRGHCCDEHHRWAVCAAPDDVATCLAVIRQLPEKCRQNRTRGTDDPYVWVDASCFQPIPRAVRQETP